MRVGDEVVTCDDRGVGKVTSIRYLVDANLYYICSYWYSKESIAPPGSCDTCKDRLQCLVNGGIEK